MSRFEEVLDRVKEVLSSEIEGRVRDADAARALGISAGAFATLKNRDRLPFEEIAVFCAKKRVSINWVLFNQNAQSLVENTEKYSFARYFGEARLSAGGGSFDLGEDFEATILPPYLTQNLRAFGTIDIAKVEGDSMEPTLKNGDLIFIDRDALRVKDGGVYAIAAAGGLFVKRVRKEPNGGVTLVSDNPVYPPFGVLSDETRLIGKVAGVFSADLR
jgi:hypothetical protein